MRRMDRAAFGSAVTACRDRLEAAFGRLLFRRALLLVTAFACVAVGVVVSHVWRVEQELQRRAALNEVAEHLHAIAEFRGLDLSSRAALDATTLKKNPHVVAEAPPIPGTYEFALAQRVVGATDSSDLSLYSPYPFPSNPKGGLNDDFAVNAWKQLSANPAQPVFTFANIGGRDVLRFATAEVMQAQCVSCHNESPWSRKRDWKVGDVAGVFELQIPRDRATGITSAAAQTLLVLLAMTALGLTAIALLIRQLKRTAGEAERLALQTEAANQALGHEVQQRRRAEAALHAANERLSTNHVQLESWAADLEIAHSRLREVDDLKTKFLSEVSHELRSPVAAIVSAAKIITKHHATKPDVVERFGKTIVSEGERMTRLINDFLDLTKIEAGCIEWNVAEVDVEAVVNGVLLNSEALAVEGGIQLIQAVDPGLPKPQADPDRLTQVLTNLVNNAIKYTPDGGSITVRALQRGRELLISVDDTGPGIPPDEAVQVFDRFRQVRAEHNDGKKRIGTGLGLCISREIVQYYGGRIWVESELGHGSSFCFTVPLQRDAAATTEPATNGTVATTSTARVLLLLDDPEAAQQAARTGAEAGLECRTCADAAELLALQPKWPPDAYIVSAALLQSDDQLLGRIRSDAVTKLLVYSREHGLTAPSLLDSAELLVPSLRGLVPVGSTVLVVEDDDKYRSLLEFELQQAGYGVRTASDGREALTSLRNHGADAMILDLIMPGMDGLAVLERLSATGGAEMPILVYTALDDPSVALAAKDLGATEVFRKDGGSGKAVYTAVTARVRRILSEVLTGESMPRQERRRSDA